MKLGCSTHKSCNSCSPASIYLIKVIDRKKARNLNLTKAPVIDIVRVALLSLNIFHIFLLLMLTMYLFAGFICFKLGRILI